MKKHLITLCLCSLLIWACGTPTPPVPPQPPVVEQRDTVVEPAIPTIDLSSNDSLEITEDSSLNLIMTSNSLHLTEASSGLAFDRLGTIDKLKLVIENGKLSYLSMDNTVLVGLAEPVKEFIPPCRLLPDGRVQVLKGASLNFIARYYGVSLKTLLRCNPSITNPDYIQAGTNLLTSCK